MINSDKKPRSEVVMNPSSRSAGVHVLPQDVMLSMRPQDILDMAVAFDGSQGDAHESSIVSADPLIFLIGHAIGHLRMFLLVLEQWHHHASRARMLGMGESRNNVVFKQGVVLHDYHLYMPLTAVQPGLHHISNPRNQYFSDSSSSSCCPDCDCRCCG